MEAAPFSLLAFPEVGFSFPAVERWLLGTATRSAFVDVGRFFLMSMVAISNSFFAFQRIISHIEAFLLSTQFIARMLI